LTVSNVFYNINKVKTGDLTIFHVTTILTSTQHIPAHIKWPCYTYITTEYGNCITGVCSEGTLILIHTPVTGIQIISTSRTAVIKNI